MRKISFLNQKGGVGKTTTTINVASCLSLKGFKVLLVDLDPQAHSTSGLGISDELDKTIYEVIKSQIPSFKMNVSLKDILVEQNGLFVAPSTLDLSSIDVEAAQSLGRDTMIQRVLSPIENEFDFILFDCPPNLGFLTLNALVSSNEVIIPVQTESFSIRGMLKLTETIDLIKNVYNKSLVITGIVATLFDSRTSLHNSILEQIKTAYNGQVFNTIIRNNIHLAEAQTFGQDIFTYKPNSSGAEDYLSLTEEIIERG